MDRKQQEKQARRRWVRRVRDIKFTAFFGFLIVMGLIGLMWFARPSTSKVEKRDLAKFPTLTWSGFWDGTFFSDVDTWYSDTFPLREMLISMNTKFKNLYGIRSVQLVGDRRSDRGRYPHRRCHHPRRERDTGAGQHHTGRDRQPRYRPGC